MDFDPFCISVFQGLTFVIVIMIDSSENTFVKVAFELQSLHVFEKCRNRWSIMENSPNRLNNINAKLAVRQAFGVNGAEI